ncbi:hypothetical protein [Stieleria varia]|uniref:hypothetical protein n=1 Tax=Stieleria varia TaxID=2528005 RepID=UPI001E31C76C|nr:hypothetical protein [Stieleria varia]
MASTTDEYQVNAENRDVSQLIRWQLALEILGHRIGITPKVKIVRRAVIIKRRRISWKAICAYFKIDYSVHIAYETLREFKILSKVPNSNVSCFPPWQADAEPQER